MQRADTVDLRPIRDTGKVEATADVDVLLRQVFLVDQQLAELIGGFGIFALLGVVVLKQELSVGLFDHRLRMGLDFVHHAQDFGDLGIERSLGAEKDIAVGVGGLVAVVHQLGVSADLGIVAGDELEQAQDAALVHGAEDKGRSCFQQVLLDVLAEADETFLKVFWPGLSNLPDVEVDEAHREHVIGKEGELILAVSVVALEGVP